MSLELDIPALLGAFDGDSRAGVDLRKDENPNNAFRKIKDARNEAREDERQADLKGEIASKATRLWRDVWSGGQEYLQNYAKDLEIVAFMIEASVRLGGFSGFTQSLMLTHELVENFWGELLPTPDEDGIETTILPITRLNGDVIAYPIIRVPMTEDTSVGEFAVWQYTQAKQLETLSPAEREKRISDGAISLELFNRSVAESSDGFYRQLLAEIESARAALSSLNASLKEKAGEEFAPNLSRLKAGLDEAEATLRVVAGNRLEVPQDASDADSDDGFVAGGAITSSGGGAARGAISNRNDAIELLEKVAVWFEQHEPQSILPAEIRKAKRRARMTPEELYIDLISDTEVRQRLFKDVGIEESARDSYDE